MKNPISGPGLLFVRSRITPSTSNTPLPESNYLAWYATHLDEVVSTSGISSAFRCVDVRKRRTTITTRSSHDDNDDDDNDDDNDDNDMPFLAFCPMQDTGFMLGEEFKRIGVRGEVLKIDGEGSGLVYDIADFDVRYYGLVGGLVRGGTTTGGCTAGKRAEGAGIHAASSKFFLTYAFRPAQLTLENEDAAVHAMRQRSSGLVESKGFIAGFEYRLQYARSNAQSRALKGLAGAEEPQLQPQPEPGPPSVMVLMGFSEQPGESLVQGLKGGLEGVEGRVEVYVWRLEAVHGEGRFYD